MAGFETVGNGVCRDGEAVSLLKLFRFKYFKAGQTSKSCEVRKGEAERGLNLTTGLNKF